MAVRDSQTRGHREQKMDSREALCALGDSLGGILRGHLTASGYVQTLDGKYPLKGNENTRYR